MNWKPLQHIGQLNDIVEQSGERYQVLFKHSTRCSISIMALNRLDRASVPAGADFFLLDLLNHRDISNEIADRFGVTHASPQVLLIKDGICIYDESHNAINMEDIDQHVSA
jgi:bacillithiol system protein YtxJ